MVIVKFKRVAGNDDISLPKYQSDGAAAFDLHAAVKDSVVILPGERKLIPTGFQMEFPKGFVAHIVPRSGLAVKHGIGIVNSPATIDCDYRGEVGIILINLGQEKFAVNRNDRVAQMLIKRYEHAELVEAADLSLTERGAGGYGSSGK